MEKPALQQPQKRSDANFQFELYGDIGQTYTVQSSTNLSDCTSLTSFVAATLPVAVLDLTATNFPARFYRTTSPPQRHQVWEEFSEGPRVPSPLDPGR